MAIALRQATTKTSAESGASYVLPLGSSQAGDFAVLTASLSGLSTFTVPTGWTALRSTTYQSNTLSVFLAWKQLDAGDITAAQITLTPSTMRPSVANLVVYSGAASLSATQKAYVQGSYVNSFDFPEITPTASGSLLVSVANVRSNVAPPERTFSLASGWNSVISNSQQATSAIHMFSLIGSRQLSGGQNIQVPAYSTVASDSVFYATDTLALSPVAAPPVIYYDNGTSWQDVTGSLYFDTGTTWHNVPIND